MNTLKQQKIWLLWNLEMRGGRPTKVPMSASGGKTGTSPNYADTWVTFDEAILAWGHLHATGVGFVIPKGYFFLDIDHSDKDAPLSRTMLSRFNSYAEISPSRTGLHIYGKCDLSRLPINEKGKISSEFYQKNSKLGLELYIGGATNRFATFTASAVSNVPLADCTTAVLETFYHEMRKPTGYSPIAQTGNSSPAQTVYSANAAMGNSSPAATGYAANAPTGYSTSSVRADSMPISTGISSDPATGYSLNAPTGNSSPAPTGNSNPAPADIGSIIQALRGQRNGAKFSRLFDSGDISSYGSHSEADLALCSIIAYRTGADPALIDEIFRASALYREKWEREDYRSATIEKAMLNAAPNSPHGTARADSRQQTQSPPPDRDEDEEEIVRALLQAMPQARSIPQQQTLPQPQTLPQSPTAPSDEDEEEIVRSLLRAMPPDPNEDEMIQALLQAVPEEQTVPQEKGTIAPRSAEKTQYLPQLNPQWQAPLQTQPLPQGERHSEKTQYLPQSNPEQQTPPGYIKKGRVSATLLAKHIRENVDYMLVSNNAKQSVMKYVYENGCYRLYSDSMLMGMIKKFICDYDENLVRMNTLKEVLGLLTTDLDYVPMDKLNADENVINFTNGLLKVSAHGAELLGHTPKLLSTIQIPCEWKGCESPTPVFDRYIHTLADGDEEVIELILETIGVAISNIKGYRMKKSVFYVGDGNTGKSQLKSLVERLLGKGNFISIDLREIENRFGTGTLYGTRLAGSSDMSFMRIDELKTFKKLTGGDSLFAEFKGQQAFEFVFDGLLWFCMNRLPKFGGDDGKWIYDRILVIKCPNVIPEDKQDKLLLEKLYAEREGIVYKAVMALTRVIANGYRFSEPTVVTKNRREYARDNNTALSFFTECMEYKSYVPIKERFTVGQIYDAYKGWCSNNNHGYAKTHREFRESLCEYLGVDHWDLVQHTNRGNCYKNYTLKKEAALYFNRFITPIFAKEYGGLFDDDDEVVVYDEDIDDDPRY